MTDVDVEQINETKIRQWIDKKECVFLVNTRDSSSLWTDLRLIAHSSTPTVPVSGWVVCAYCNRLFRSHSSMNKKGKRKNYGLTSAARHLEQCARRKKEMTTKHKQQKSIEHSDVDQFSPSSSVSPILNQTLSKFVYNKSTLPKAWQNRVKDAECKYVVAGIYN